MTTVFPINKDVDKVYHTFYNADDARSILIDFHRRLYGQLATPTPVGVQPRFQRVSNQVLEATTAKTKIPIHQYEIPVLPHRLYEEEIKALRDRILLQCRKHINNNKSLIMFVVVPQPTLTNPSSLRIRYAIIGVSLLF